MKLEFNSTEELESFLEWSLRYGAAWAAMQRGPRRGDDEGVCASPAITGTVEVAGLAFPQLDDVTPLDTGTSASDGDTRMPPPVTGDPSGAVLQPVTEPAKRKRRTKAEIEADETAAAEAAAAELAKAQQTGQVQPESGTTSPTGANPFDQPSTLQDVGAEGQAATDASSESDVVTPFQHLTRAREFIAKHGMPKYNESFAKAGLDANVMGYTAYQRGVHMSALDELEKV